MTAMADKLIDLMDLIVWRVPTPAQLERLSDHEAEQRYITALAKDRQRRAGALAAEIDRRDYAARAARQRQLAREQQIERARARQQNGRYEYDLAIHAMYLQADRECRGVLLSEAGLAAGVDPIALFSGPAARANRLASEELRNWWLDHPRITYAEWKRQSRETYDPTATVAA